jgi:hypothetical protein
VKSIVNCFDGFERCQQAEEVIESLVDRKEGGAREGVGRQGGPSDNVVAGRGPSIATRQHDEFDE